MEILETHLEEERAESNYLLLQLGWGLRGGMYLIGFLCQWQRAVRPPSLIHERIRYTKFPLVCNYMWYPQWFVSTHVPGPSRAYQILAVKHIEASYSPGLDGHCLLYSLPDAIMVSWCEYLIFSANITVSTATKTVLITTPTHNLRANLESSPGSPHLCRPRDLASGLKPAHDFLLILLKIVRSS